MTRQAGFAAVDREAEAGRLNDGGYSQA